MHAPAWRKVSKGICHVTTHRNDDGPFTAQIFDHYWRQKHRGQNDGRIDDTE